MEFKQNENTLTLYFEGELNSYNAEQIDAEIEKVLTGKTFTKIALDFSKLNYISSAGLRIILKLKQKYKNVVILEANLEVYDILSMTGFVDVLEVKKALKRVDVSNAEVIGEGYFSTVYRVDKDMIIKVFNRTSDPDQIERELSLAKEAFILGIPTAISFDIVRVGEKLGVRFEMLDCMSLKDAFKNQPDKYQDLIKRYVDLLIKINTTVCSLGSRVPKIKDFYLEKVEFIKNNFTEEQYQRIKKIILSIPDEETFIHGDCHFKNIMVQGDELLLIDMDTLSRGHPIFELAAIYAPYVAFEEDDPGNTERFLGMPKDLVQNIYHDLVKGYFGKEDPVIYEKIALVSYIHMVWWNRINEPSNMKRLEGCKGRLLKLLDKYADVEIK